VIAMRAPPLLKMIGFSLLGNSSLVVQPMIVGGLVDNLHFTERQAGFVASVELSGLSLGMLLLLGVAQWVPRSVLAGLAIATVVAANVSACLVHQFELMLIVRFVAGFGAAMALAVFLAMGASQPCPEDTFAVVNAISIAYSGVFSPIAPVILAVWRLPGLFLILAGVALLMFPLVSGLDIAAHSTGQPSLSPSTAANTKVARYPAQVVMLLMMMALLYTGHGAVWAYQQRIGVGLGLPVEEIGKWIGLSMLIGGVGGSLAAWRVSMRLGRMWPQLLSLSISSVAAILLVNGTTPTLFAVACGLIALSWFYGLPYQMGLLAAFDPRGRANMAGIVMTTGGSSAGPALAAVLVGYAGHVAIGALAATCYVLSLLLVLPSVIGRQRAITVEGS